jgi:trigger factor
VLPKKDDFAATLATDGQMNSMEELTAEVRKTLENNLKEVTEDKYLNQVIEKILEGAQISFPQAMLEDYLDRSVEDLDQSLRRRYGLTLDDYLRIMQQSREQVREMRREGAVKDMSTTLALQQVASDEELFLTEEQLDAEIEKHLSQYEPQFRDAVRSFYTGETRENFGSRLVSDRVTRRLMDIAKGANPAKGPDPIEETDADASASADTGPAPDEAVDSTSTDSE